MAVPCGARPSGVLRAISCCVSEIQVDVWALGILLFQLLYQANDQTIQNVLNGLSLEGPRRLTTEPTLLGLMALGGEPAVCNTTSSLLLGMLNTELDRRPSIGVVCDAVQAVLSGQDPGESSCSAQGLLE